MIIYQGEYKFVHQIEPDHKILGYFSDKNKLIDKIDKLYNVGLNGRIALGNDHKFVRGSSYFYINEITLEG